MKICILSPLAAPNSSAFVRPLLRYRKRLQSRKIDVRLQKRFSPRWPPVDVLGVDSKVLRAPEAAGLPAEVAALCRLLATKTRILLWFDTTDGSGSPQLQVLPYVHGYYKSSLLRDRELYCRPIHGGRVFSAYYRRGHGIADEEGGESSHLAQKDHLHKLHVGWNSYFGDYSAVREWLQRCRRVLPLDLRLPIAWRPPQAPRERDVFCRMRMDHGRATVEYHRKLVAGCLAEKMGVDCSPVPGRKYHAEMRRSRIVVSPFGWGEIAFRDFEAFIAGCALLKPDMHHMETWPDLYIDGETCAMFNWDATDLPARVEWLLTGGKWLEIARRGQRLYAQYVDEEWGQERFCSRFEGILLSHLEAEGNARS